MPIEEGVSRCRQRISSSMGFFVSIESSLGVTDMMAMITCPLSSSVDSYRLFELAALPEWHQHMCFEIISGIVATRSPVLWPLLSSVVFHRASGSASVRSCSTYANLLLVASPLPAVRRILMMCTVHQNCDWSRCFNAGNTTGSHDQYLISCLPIVHCTSRQKMVLCAYCIRFHACCTVSVEMLHCRIAE